MYMRASSPLDNEDTGIADFSSPVLCKLEAVRAVILVLTAVREPRAVINISDGRETK